MRRLMPDFILDNYAAGNTSGEFAAAALFVDVTGFSSMTDGLMGHGQHGAEVLAAVMRAALTPLIQSAVEQGGFIAIQAGDAFTAIFPFGDEVRQMTHRALAAAWNIQVRAGEQPVHRTVYGDFPVTVKIGASLGQVAWGILHSRSGQQAAYYFRGRAIDSSAEAQQQAKAGQIILDASFYEKVQGRVSVEPAGAFFRLAGVTSKLPPPEAITTREQDATLVERFFPSEILAQRHSGEFRQVVYLFASMERSEDEAGLQEFIQHIFDLQSRYGGLLSVHFGDKGAHVLLLWGAPASHENDVQRALNFVLDLRERTGGELKAGLAYRIAHAGLIGSDLAEQYAAYGRGPNLASRFMQAAPAGAIWVDDYIAQRAAQTFELTYVGDQAFKGFATPLKVHALRWRKEHSETFFPGALVGREAELNQLARFVRPILDGRYAGLVLVRGEPGMGKSHLVDEFIQRLHDDKPNRFQEFLAQTDEILREGLNPFIYWLRHYFDLSAAEPEEVNRERFTRGLDALIAGTPHMRLAGELDRTRSFLGALLGLRWSDSLYEQLDAQGRHENTLIGLTTLLQAESLRKPVILVLEDVQWLDASSEEYVARLHRTLTADERARYPLVILATVRSRELGQSLEELVAGGIELGVLDRPGLAALAEAHLGGPASEDLALLLEVHSEGNPFFAEQVLRYLQERHLLVRGDSGWELGSNYIPSLLPLNVSAVLVARLDRLAREVRETVQTAAILGREFEIRLLSHMLKSGAARSFDRLPAEAIHSAVMRAEAEAIWAALDELRYIFRHALLRDTAYQMQIEVRRQELHGLAAAALEAVFHDEISLHYAELAYHADNAAMRDKARGYYEKAADSAAEAYLNSQAADYYSRAFSLTPEDDFEGQYALLMRREQILEAFGDPETRLADLTAMDALIRRLDDKARLAYVFMRQARFAFDGGDLPNTIDFARQAIEEAVPLGQWNTAILAYALLAQALSRSGKAEEAMKEMELGLELARKSGSLLERSVVYNDLGMLGLEQRNARLAQESFETSLSLARQAGDLVAESRPLNNLGLVAGSLGDFPSAQRYYEEALALDRRVGSRRGEAIVLANLGWLAGTLGEPGKARAYLERQLRLVREIGDTYTEAYGWINMSSQSNELRDYETAVQQAERGLALARKVGDRSGEAWALTYLGRGQQGLGELNRAAESFRQAIAIRQDLDQPGLATEPEAGLAIALLSAGEVPAALEITEHILGVIKDPAALNGTDDPLRVHYACYLVLDNAQDPRARTHLETAHRELQERAAQMPEAEMRSAFLNNVESHRLIWQAWQAEGRRGEMQ